jgi:phospholipase/carboxylesterase
VPVVEGWEPALESRQGMRAFIAHGRSDPIIGVDFGRRARELLERGEIDVEYHETDAAHQIDLAVVPRAVDWLAATL